MLIKLELSSFELLRLLLFLSFLGYTGYIISGRKKILSYISGTLLIIAFISLTFNLGIRIYGGGRAPFANLYESLLSFAWGLILIYLGIEIIYKINILGIFTSALAFITIAYASSLPRTIEPLMPALQSHWLTFHVLCFVFAYGAFALSFGGGIVYIILDRVDTGKKETIEKFLGLTIEIIEKFIYKMITFAFPFMTLGIITGAIWANKAWGSYWSWDPKETWSLITWLVYAAFLHARYNYSWKGKITAIISIIGFVVVLFTYLGVNYFLPGLHSYAK